MARPTKMTPDNVQRILTALRAANTRRAAARYGRIEEHTLERWMRRFTHFAQQVDLAEGEAHVAVVAHLLTQIQAGDVQAIKFWLERRYPAEWGPPKSESRVDVNMSGSGVHIYLPARAEGSPNGSSEPSRCAS